jgi:ABC-type Na+ efflux pump permease subunit
MSELTAPRARTRARRRKMPRPPKFTRWQKWSLGINAAFCAFLIASFIVTAEPAALIGVASFIAYIHATVMDALHPPAGGLRSDLLGMALGVFSLALWFA